jgi:hypothetical protein
VKGKRKGKKQYTPALTGTKHKTKIQKKGGITTAITACALANKHIKPGKQQN